MRRSAIPAAILVAVAIGNRAVVATTDLSAWELGGFGMFSTLDAPHTRLLRATITMPDGGTATVTELGGQDELAQQLRVWPTRDRAQRLAQGLASMAFESAEEQAVPAAAGVQPQSVRVELFSLVPQADSTDGSATLGLELIIEASSS